MENHHLSWENIHYFYGFNSFLLTFTRPGILHAIHVQVMEELLFSPWKSKAHQSTNSCPFGKNRFGPGAG